MAMNSILRSNVGNKYLTYVYESIDKAIKARDSEKKVLPSITNSY